MKRLHERLTDFENEARAEAGRASKSEDINRQNGMVDAFRIAARLARLTPELYELTANEVHALGEAGALADLIQCDVVATAKRLNRPIRAVHLGRVVFGVDATGALDVGTAHAPSMSTWNQETGEAEKRNINDPWCEGSKQIITPGDPLKTHTCATCKATLGERTIGGYRYLILHVPGANQEAFRYTGSPRPELADK